MNIDYVIVSSDESWYLDFWPIVSKLWKKFLGVTTVMALITDKNSDFYDDGNGIVKKFKSVIGVPTHLQSQIIRLYVPKLLDGYCMLSDMDMIPLSSDYFIVNSKDIKSEDIIVFSSDNKESLNENMYPMCYILAHSKIFNIFSSDMSWEEFCIMINDLNLGWCSDQLFLYDKINEYHKKTNNVKLLNRGWPGGHADKRIDRSSWIYDEKKLKESYYIDCHLLRPYNQNKNEIDKLIKLIT